ncbi:MAG: hypothetical protein WCH43_08590, partial [Verrucomicrobiota bacterium]
QGADSVAGPWTDLARSTAGSPFTVMSAGATVTETGTGTVRSEQVTDVYSTTDPAHPRRFMRIQVQH